MIKVANEKISHITNYTPEFREHALALADTIGVAQSARELNLYESELYMF